MSTSEVQLVPGDPLEWREFDLEDYDPAAAIGSDDDALGALLAERTLDDQFGIVLLADPLEPVDDELVKRLMAALVPTKLRRLSRDEHKVADKKTKKKTKE